MTRQVLLVFMLSFASVTSLQAQTLLTTQHSPELSVILEPGPMRDGLPQNFTVHLVNVGQNVLRIPDPEIGCGNVGDVGSIVIHEGWQPPTGSGMGTGICDRGGFSPAPVPPPLAEVARTWHLVAPGGSLYIQAPFVLGHSAFTAAGAHSYSATYLPPQLTKAQLEALRELAIQVPMQSVDSSSLTYNTDSSSVKQH